MKQRIRDWLHERAIARQSKLTADLMKFGPTGDARRECARLERLLKGRSPQQIARMERAQFLLLDPHAQQTFLDSQAGRKG